MKIQIVADSAADLPLEFVLKNNIEVVPRISSLVTKLLRTGLN